MSLARDGLDGNAGTGTFRSFVTNADDEVELDEGSAAEDVFAGATDAALMATAASAAYCRQASSLRGSAAEE